MVLSRIALTKHRRISVIYCSQRIVRYTVLHLHILIVVFGEWICPNLVTIEHSPFVLCCALENYPQQFGMIDPAVVNLWRNFWIVLVVAVSAVRIGFVVVTEERLCLQIKFYSDCWHCLILFTIHDGRRWFRGKRTRPWFPVYSTTSWIPNTTFSDRPLSTWIIYCAVLCKLKTNLALSLKRSPTGGRQGLLISINGIDVPVQYGVSLHRPSCY